MTVRRRSGSFVIAAGLCLVLVAVSGAALLSAGNGHSGGDEAAARRAADAFLDRYMNADGRVVRRDQGGDTVSEGQAYAMLLAAATGDRDRFAAAWGWARQHLRRPDGLLSWSWRDGRVQDPQPAADADLDAARALLVAARRFGVPSYRADALRIGHGVLAHETTRARRSPVLVPGPWAQGDGTVNPSYFSPRSYSELRRASGDRRWNRLAASSLRLSAGLLSGRPPLPPNWARVQGGRATPIPAPGGGEPPAYGYDAARLPVRLAESCDVRAHRLAARMWPFLRGQVRRGRVAPVYALNGAPLAPGEHPLGLVAAAASARAAGDGRAVHDLLRRVDAADRRGHTYYGAAWTALGRVMLTTDLLGGC